MSIAAGILAGGQSRRFGSDKAWALLDGKPLIEHLIESLKPQVDAILVSVRAVTPTYQRLGLPLVVDGDRQGPLAGVVALLGACRHDWLLVAPCDVVRLPADWVQQLMQAANVGLHPLVVLHDGLRAHPTLCLIQANLFANAAVALAAGETALYRWQQTVDCAWLRAAAPLNINGVDQLREAASSARWNHPVQ